MICIQVRVDEYHLLVGRAQFDLVLGLLIKHIHLQVRNARPHRTHVNVFVVLLRGTDLLAPDVANLVLMQRGNTGAAGLRQ